MAPSVSMSVVAPGAHLTGQLATGGDLVIGGHVEGKVSGRAVTILDTGSLTGDLTARSAEIHGSVTGTICAHHIAIAATARVEGELRFSGIQMETGANVDARCIPELPPESRTEEASNEMPLGLVPAPA